MSLPVQLLIVFTVCGRSTKSSWNCSQQLFTAITSHKLLFFFTAQSSTLNSLFRPFNEQFRYLVIFFRPQHSLCLQPELFVLCQRKYLYKSLFNAVFIKGISWLCQLFLLIYRSKAVQQSQDDMFIFNFSQHALHPLGSGLYFLVTAVFIIKFNCKIAKIDLCSISINSCIISNLSIDSILNICSVQLIVSLQNNSVSCMNIVNT